MLAAALVAAVTAGGCTGGLRTDAEDRTWSERHAVTGAAPTLTPGAAQYPGGRTPAPAACTPGPGKQIEKLPDVTIPPIRQPATTVADQTIGGELVAGFTIPAVEQPALVIDTGCVVRYDAPAGCLGAVEITEFTIPAQELPGFVLPGYSVGGKQVPEQAVAGDQRPAVTVAGDRAEQICQRQPNGNSRYIPSVSRKSLYRQSGYRPSLYRKSASRPTAYLDEGRVNSVQVPGMKVDNVQVHSASVDAARIDSVILEDADGTTVSSGEGRTAYSTQADVLFDFGQAELKPAALPTLRRISADLQGRIPNANVQVDGHTDAIGEDAANLDLSTRRAEAVKAWLSTDGGVTQARIRTTGYGESAPIVPNATPSGVDDPTGRAQNRRVVISAGNP